MKLSKLQITLSCLVLVHAGPGVAAEKETATSLPESQLTAEEKAERDGRKACKVAICDAFHNRKPSADITCKVTKSLPKTQIEKLAAKAKASWP